MSEKNKNSAPLDDDFDEDDEFESLSQDEKAAFEKIMAEIAEAENPGSTADDKAVSEPEAPPPDPPIDDDADTVSDDSPTSAEVPEADISENDSNGNSDDDGDPDEALDEDQQAVLDQIMSDIESKKEKDIDTSVQDNDEDDNDDDSLNEDQQAALEQIMAEIGSNKKSDADDEASSEEDEEAEADEDDEDDESLDEDQQAALDQIMAEIGSNKKSDADDGASSEEDEEAEADEDDEGDEDDESLNEDQQAALDQIMAEIGSKKKSDTPETQEDETESDDNSESGLSLDEFGSELEQLLKSNEQQTEAEKADEDEPAAPSGETTEEISDEPSSSHDDQPEPEPAVLTEVTETPDTETDKETETDTEKDYPILKEVGEDDEVPLASEKPSRKSKSSAPKKPKPRMKTVMISAVAALAFFILCAGGYWGYRAYSAKNSVNMLADTTPADQSQPSPGSEPVPDSLEPSPGEAQPENTVTRQLPVYVADDNNPMVALASRLAYGRQQLQTKITEIEELTSYYQKGIEEERQRLDEFIQQFDYRRFEQAEQNSKILLTLQAIQRRMAYVDSLEAPLYKVRQGAEELLFLERRAQMYALLTTYASSIPLSGFEQEALQRLQFHLEQSRLLRIDNIEGTKPSLKSIWDDIRQKPVKASRTPTPVEDKDPLNSAISKEICNGDYSRRYQLTHLSSKTATCLLNWGGKDLYLNDVNVLQPSVAKILAQWKGDWLSLNGLKELSPEAARHLAGWNGKRLSLNGLVRLSPQATIALSQWKGEQLEMIGLVEIGPWENYGTRLFLSEQLKKKIEGR